MLKLIVQETAPKNTEDSKNELESILKMAEIGHHPKAIASKKCQFGLKMKNAKNDCTTTLESLCAKKISKKHLIFDKRDYFENSQTWSRHKGYSLCKMVSLAQKLKMPKRCQNRLYDHVTVVVCKKTALKKHLIFEKWEHFENGQNWPRRRGFSLCKWSVWFKNKKCQKGSKNDCLNTLNLLVKKTAPKDT